MEVIEAQRYGLYHLSNSGACSRYELAVQAAEFAALDPSRVIGKPVSENGPHRSAARNTRDGA